MKKHLLFLALAFSSVAMAQLPANFKRNPIQAGQVLLSTTFSVNHNESTREAGLLTNFDETYRVDWDVTLRSGYFTKDNLSFGGFKTIGQRLSQLQFQGDNGTVYQKQQLLAF